MISHHHQVRRYNIQVTPTKRDVVTTGCFVSLTKKSAMNKSIMKVVDESPPQPEASREANDTPTKKNKVVMFSSVKPDVFKTLNRYEYTQEERGATWYRGSEWNQMKNDVKKVVAQMTAASAKNDGRIGSANYYGDESIRGLAHRTPKGRKLQIVARQTLIEAVIEEQIYQTVLIDNDNGRASVEEGGHRKNIWKQEEAIAKVSRGFTRKYARIARARGMLDEIEAAA